MVRMPPSPTTRPRGRFLRVLGLFGLVAIGYVLGASRTFAPRPVEAQQLLDMPSLDTIGKIKTVNDAVVSAAADLKAESMYRDAATVPNPFGVLVGGLDAMEDLRTGRGVDPMTYAALHAGLGTEEVKLDIAKNARGQLTYKDRVITMYSVDRLKKLFAKQQRLLDTR